jgi:hypothetical protein
MDAAVLAELVFDDDEMLELQAILVGVLALGAEHVRLQKNRLRNPSRLYLCRPQLLPNPRILTPWTQLYESNNDRAYITTMGFDVATFHYILDSGFAARWNSTPIPRADVSRHGQPRIGSRSLDAAGALGLTLHFLSSAMRELSLQQIFTLIPATVNHYLDFALDILARTLRDMPEGVIHFPSHDEIIEDNLLIRARHSRLVGGFASIDGLSLPCQEADDPEVENATYNGWKSSHFISNVLVFSPRGRFIFIHNDIPGKLKFLGVIISAVLNAPGSWHDSHTSRPIYKQLRCKTPFGGTFDGCVMGADECFVASKGCSSSSSDKAAVGRMGRVGTN